MLPPRAYTFIGLNAVRALSIIAILLMFASSVVTLVHDIQAVNSFVNAGKAHHGNSTESADAMLDCDYIENSTVPNQPAGAFWAVLNRLLIIFQLIVLLLSELGWPSSFFAKFFPVLGPDFGLGALGVIQCLIGAAVLSHHVDTFALVSGFFLFALGCLNIFLGLVFRASAKPRRSIFAWRERAKDVLPKNVDLEKNAVRVKLPGGAGVAVDFGAGGRPVLSANPPSFVSRVYDGYGGYGAGANEKEEDVAELERAPSAASSRSGYGFGRQGEKAAGLKGFVLTKPLETLPRYAPKSNGSA